MTSKPTAPISMEVPDRGGHVWLHGSERDLAKVLLRRGAMTAPAIGREMGVSQDYAELLCRSLLKKGAVAQVNGRRIYDLPAGVREHLHAES